MKNYSIVHRSYDLRAVYPTEIDEDFYLRLGYAFTRHTGAKRIMVGYDARLSSPSLSEAFIKGIILSGGTPVSIGLCSSDMLSFGTNFYSDIEAGAMITASHNPKDQNGLKCIYHGGMPINLKTAGPHMAKIMEDFSSPLKDIGDSSRMDYEKRDILNDWVRHILSFSATKDFSGLRIVVDGGNGAAGAFLPELAKAARFEMIPLFLEPDGNFPNHHPNPMLPENREFAKQKVIETGAHLALLFDGDADRVVILNSHGEMIVSGIICAVIASSLLSRLPGGTVAGNAVISHTFRDTAETVGGKYIRTRVDSVAIKVMMLENPDIIFAGEHSTHYFVQENWSGDSGIVAVIIFLDILMRSRETLDELISSYHLYETLEETNFVVRDREEVIQTMTEMYKDETVDFLDGLTVNYLDGSWWNVRAGSNDPVIRLNMEAKTRERFEELKEELTKTLSKFAL